MQSIIQTSKKQKKQKKLCGALSLSKCARFGVLFFQLLVLGVHFQKAVVMQNSLFPFNRFHQVGVAPVICNRLVASKVPPSQRNFYLDTPPAVLRVVFKNSSPAQLAAHFLEIRLLLLSHSFNCNKRRALFKLLRFLQSLGASG